MEAAVAPAPGWLRAQLRRQLGAFLFVLPGLVLFVLVVIRPSIDTVRYSLYNWDGLGPMTDFVGGGNYAKAVHDPEFWKSAKNNLFWIGLTVPTTTVLGLVAAVLLATRPIGRTAYRVLYFLPVVQASAVVALTWGWLYHPNGPLTTGLDKLGLGFLVSEGGWLGSTTWALPAVALASVWAGFGFSMVIFLAGIQGIDPALYDAAQVDGAGPLASFRYVTLPGLRSVTTLVVVLALIGSFQVFDLLFILTPGGGVDNSTQVISTLLYDQGFSGYQFGYGCALSVILMAVIFVFSWLYLAVRERNEQ